MVQKVPFSWRGDREAEGRQMLDHGMRPDPGWSGGVAMRREGVRTVSGLQWVDGRRPSLDSWHPEWFTGTERGEKMIHTWVCAQDEEQCCPHENSHAECSLQLYL